MFGKTAAKAAAAIVAVCLCICMAGCGTDDIDISEYAGEEIVLSGIAEEDIVITIADLKAMECKTIKTESTSDKIGVVKATGPELNTVLEPYGVSKGDFSKVKFHGTDSYDIPLNRDYVSEHEIYLAFGIDGKPLDGESKPCRVIIPNSDSAYWIRMVDRIEFEK